MISWLATACNVGKDHAADTSIAPKVTEVARPSATATPTAISTDTATPTITPTATSTSTPSPTTTFTPTPTPTTSPKALRAKWRAPLALSAFTFATCEWLNETAERRQSGELDGVDAFSEQLGAAIIVRAVDEGLAEWEPHADQIGLRDRIQMHVYSLGNLLAQWYDDEVDSAGVLQRTEGLCQSTERTFERVVEKAVEDGLPSEEAKRLIQETAEKFGKAVDESEGSGSSGPD